MSIKIDNLLRFFKDEIKEGSRWGDIPLTLQVTAVNILYNDNKSFYDELTRGSTVQGKCDVLIEDCYTQYDFLQSRINPFYDNLEA